MQDSFVDTLDSRFSTPSNVTANWKRGDVKQDPSIRQFEGHVDKMISNFVDISVSLKLFLHMSIYNA